MFCEEFCLLAWLKAKVFLPSNRFSLHNLNMKINKNALTRFIYCSYVFYMSSLRFPFIFFSLSRLQTFQHLFCPSVADYFSRLFSMSPQRQGRLFSVSVFCLKDHQKLRPSVLTFVFSPPPPPPQPLFTCCSLKFTFN